MTATVEPVARPDIAGFDAMSDRLRDLIGVINTATAALTAEVAEILATESWAVGGVRSPEHFLTWQCGISNHHAGRLIQIARRREELTECTALFDEGALGEDAMTAIARHVPEERDGEVARLAPILLHPQLTKLCRNAPRPAKKDEPEPERSGWSGYDTNGGWHCAAHADAEVGGVFEKALQAARRDLFLRSNPDADPNAPVGQVSWLDALAHMSETALNAFDPAVNRGGRPGDRYQVLVHLNLRNLEPVAALHQGPLLRSTLARYLSCDSQAAAVVWDGEELVGIHPATRTVPDRLRAVIEERDGGCRVPGCNGHVVHIHHHKHWEDGGLSTPANLFSLCPMHHRMHHAGELLIEGDPTQLDGLEFRSRNGAIIGARPPTPATHPPAEPPDHLCLPRPRFDHPTGEQVDWRYYEWPDLPSQN